MAKRRSRGDGGLIQRHDHPTCPPLVTVGTTDSGKPIKERAAHTCKGRWVGTLEATEAGQPKRKYVYGRTQREAKAKLDKARREKADGTLVVTTTTVERWLTGWLDAKAKPPKALKPQTLRSYESKVRLYLIPHLGSHRLPALTPIHIETMYDSMREADLAEATLRQTHAILKKALADAIRRGVLAVSPMDRVEPPTTEKAKRRPLTVGEARVVLVRADTIPDGARWWLALFYGMRQGEVLGLRWCDIDWSRDVLRIQQTQQTDERYRIIYGPPKSKAGARLVPLVEPLASRLRDHWTAAGSPIVGQPCAEVTGICQHGLVFTNGPRPIQPSADNKAWHRLLADATPVPWAPIPDVALHAARNSAASLMEAAGIPDRLVAQILGQAQVATTHGYQSAELERMRSALEGAGRVLELG